jgi:arginase
VRSNGASHTIRSHPCSNVRLQLSGRGGVHLLGVPFSSKGRTDGVALGPAALRDAGLVDGLSAAGVDVTDRGDVELGGAINARDPSSGLIDPTALVEMIRAVRAEVRAIRGAGAFPLVIGGDCPILLGCLGTRGLASPGLLFVDGHEDAWPPAQSTTGEAADMELGLALGVTVEGLPDSLASELPRLEPDRVVVIGPRDARELAEAGVSSISDVVQVVRPDAVAAAGADRVGADAVSHLARKGPWWLHVDLDVMSTESLSAVDYRQPGGFDWATLEALTRWALSGPRLIGWDVTIYNPDLDPNRTGARRIIRYLSQALGELGTPSG